MFDLDDYLCFLSTMERRVCLVLAGIIAVEAIIIILELI